MSIELVLGLWRLIENKSRREGLRLIVALRLLSFGHILVTLVILPSLVVLIRIVLVASVWVEVLEVLFLNATVWIGGLLSISLRDKSLDVVIGWVELLIARVKVFVLVLILLVVYRL
jgi:hypothetical protein